jgi:hypothetical protein
LQREKIPIDDRKKEDKKLTATKSTLKEKKSKQYRRNKEKHSILIIKNFFMTMMKVKRTFEKLFKSAK